MLSASCRVGLTDESLGSDHGPNPEIESYETLKQGSGPATERCWSHSQRGQPTTSPDFRARPRSCSTTQSNLTFPWLAASPNSSRW